MITEVKNFTPSALRYRRRVYSHYSKMLAKPKPLDEKKESRWWRRVYSYYLRGWLPSDKSQAILDAACGRGDLLKMLQSVGYSNLHGIDISPPQVERAQQVIKSVVLGDCLTHLQKHREAFDLIIGLDIIEHFTKDEALSFLDACYHALRPEGRLILQTPNAESPFGQALRYGDFTHEACYSADGLGWVFKLCGFQDWEARPCEPRPRGFSFLRYLLWKIISLRFLLYNFAEGHRHSGIYTRTFLISARKKSKDLK